MRGDAQAESWSPWVLTNKRLESFYRAQNFVNGDQDWDSFLHHLKQPLPACFRIYQDYAFARELQDQLLGFVGQKLVIDGQEIEAVEQLAWYPGGFGYKMGTDRKSIRKLDGLNDLHKWMVRHTENGNITRQEAVSMVPPLALDVHPTHKCLDVCAAPGSKTSQLLEIVNRSLDRPPNEQGLVVANDCDTDRAYMLVHQCRRISSPLLVVTTHKGQDFPTIGDVAASVAGAGSTTQLADAAPDSPQQFTRQFFDRVLCDVPCSGNLDRPYYAHSNGHSITIILRGKLSVRVHPGPCTCTLTRNY